METLDSAWLWWSGLFCGFAAFSGYYLLRVVQAAAFIHHPQSDHISLIRNCPTLCSKFRPAVFLLLPNLQTIGTKLCRVMPQVKYRREEIPVLDGVIALDWPIEQPQLDENSTGVLVILLHGLAGSSNSKYIKHVLKHIRRKQWHVVVFNARGMGTSFLTSHRCFNACNTEDIRIVCNHLRNSYPHMTLYGIGFSMGANILTKYIGEEGENCFLKGAVGVSNPFDLAKAARKVFTDWNMRFYSWFLTRELVDYIRKHEHLFRDKLNLEKVWKCRQLHEFDDEVILKIFADQFESREDYYTKASSSRYISHVRIPMLFLNALDDPVSPSECIPVVEIKNNPHTLLAVTKRGGHIGWLTNGKFWENTWADHVCIEYLSALHEKHHSKGETG